MRSSRNHGRHRRMSMVTSGIALVAVLAPLLATSVSAPVAAAAGAETTRVDTSFGGGFASHSLSDLDDQATAIALPARRGGHRRGPDGNEPFDHTPGDIFAARLHSAGGLDPSFGTGGVAVIGAAERARPRPPPSPCRRTGRS